MQPADQVLQNKIKAVRATMITLPRKVGVTALNFTHQRFREQAWVDRKTEPWRRKNGGSKRNRGRAIGVHKGRMRRGNRIKQVTRASVTLGNDVPYAKAHNNGFKGVVTVRSHTRSVKGKRVIVGAHKRKMNIRKNQFMGPSMVLDKQVKRVIAAELAKALK